MDERSRKTQEIVRGDRVTITAVIATYNEEAHIGTCLQNLLDQEGVKGEIEILVVDGMSTDRTVDIVRSFPEFGSTIRLLRNARRLQIFAWNEALREARGAYFAMILAHARYERDYLASCLETMQRTGACAVGGVQRAYGEGALGQAIAWCMSTSLGMGNARYRYARTEEEADSVFSIFTRSQTLRDVGGYDERLPFDEDSDLNYRLRAAGGRLVVSPRIRVRYCVRRSLHALWLQMYRYGYWRRQTQRKHRGVPLRVLAPPALLAALALSAILAATPLRAISALAPALYVAFVVCAAGSAVARLGSKAALVPGVLATMHVAYGCGYWASIMRTFQGRVGRPRRIFAR